MRLKPPIRRVHPNPRQQQRFRIRLENRSAPGIDGPPIRFGPWSWPKVGERKTNEIDSGRRSQLDLLRKNIRSEVDVRSSRSIKADFEFPGGFRPSPKAYPVVVVRFQGQIRLMEKMKPRPFAVRRSLNLNVESRRALGAPPALNLNLCDGVLRSGWPERPILVEVGTALAKGA